MSPKHKRMLRLYLGLVCFLKGIRQTQYFAKFTRKSASTTAITTDHDGSSSSSASMLVAQLDNNNKNESNLLLGKERHRLFSDKNASSSSIIAEKRIITTVLVIRDVLAGFASSVWENSVLQTTSFFLMAKDTTTSSAATSSSSKDTSSSTSPFYFAACLLYKDDNQILPEWLAYHYTTAPLRRVIIGTDPFSLTSPKRIIDEYQQEIGMDISLWSEDEYHQGQDRIKLANTTKEERYKGHLKRQVHFYSKCLEQLRSENQTWTIFIDTDEMMTLNRYKGKEEGDPYSCLREFEKRKQTKEELDNCTRHFHNDMENKRLPRAYLPVVGEPKSTLAHVIEGETDVQIPLFEDYGCVCFPRTLFGPHPSEAAQISAMVPEGFDPHAFHTLSHRKHEKWQSHYPGKCIVDLSRNRHIREIKKVHKMLPENLCNAGPTVTFSDAIFRIHHYTGTVEEFTSRPGDVTRTPKKFQSRTSWAPVGGGDDDARSWLQMFVNQVGKDKAYALTVGLQTWARENDATFIGGKTNKASSKPTTELH